MDNMYIAIVFTLSVMNLKKADCGLHINCYRFYSNYWDPGVENTAGTNIGCEHYCKATDIDHTFSATFSDMCYCRKTPPPSTYEKPASECTRTCSGASTEFCGGSTTLRVTVSIIDRPPDIVTTTISQTTTTTSLAIRESPTTTSADMLITDTSQTIVTTESFSTISENLQYLISTVTNPTSSQTTTDVALSTTDRVNQKKTLCRCPKSLVNTKWRFFYEMGLTDSEATTIILQHFYENILPEITVDKRAVTKEVRKRTSAENKTQPAQFIGWGCIVFLILPIVILVSIDLLNCCIYFQKRSRRNKRNRINSM